MDDHAAALRRLIDKDEIGDALTRYARGVDRHDVQMVTEVYHPDAVDDHGVYIGGVAGFIAYANGTHSKHWNVHHHYLSNQSIDLDGDVAHCETYYLATLRRIGDTGVDLVGGRYLDRFERREGRWAVAQRACLVEWTAEALATSAPVDPDLFLSGRWDRDDLSYARPLPASRPKRDLFSTADRSHARQNARTPRRRDAAHLD